MLNSAARRVLVLAATALIAIVAMLVISGSTQQAHAQIDDGQSGIAPVNATYHGVLPVETFRVGVLQYDAWSYRDIVFYSPPGMVTQPMANQWLAWYQATDDILRILVGEDQGFDATYRRFDPNMGRQMKVLITPPDSCGAGCGNKMRAEGVGIIDNMVREPDNFEHHWILFYEQARGGYHETFDLSAVWPRKTYMLPHLAAALTYYEIAGLDGLVGVPKGIYEGIDLWSNYSTSYVDQFVDREQEFFFDEYPNGDYIYPPVTSMMMRIAVENDIATVGRVFDELRHYPDALLYDNSTQAMCDFRAAVSAGTNGRYDRASVELWRLPADCANVFDTSASNDAVAPDDLFFPSSNLCADARFKPLTIRAGTMPCDGSLGQRAELVPVGDRYIVRLGDTGRCLRHSEDEASSVLLWRCNNDADQQWIVEGANMKNASGTLCLTAPMRNRWGGGLLSLIPCDGRATQQILSEGSVGTVGAPPPPPPVAVSLPPTGSPSGSYRLQSVMSGKCIDQSGDLGVEMIQWTCHEAGNQQFVSQEIAGVGVRLTIAGSGHCLDVSGSRLLAWSCHRGKNQVFYWSGSQLVSADTGECLTVSGGSRENGATIGMDRCANRFEQQFRADGIGILGTPPPSPPDAQPASGSPSGAYSLQNLLSGRCIDQPGFDAGVEIIQWLCHGGDNQRLVSREVPGGVRLSFAGSGHCLDVSGSKLLAWSCHSGKNQVFYWSGSQLVSADTGECVTVSGGSRENAATIEMARCANRGEQQFVIG